MRIEQEHGRLTAGAAAPLSQHVPALQLHDAAGAAHQQHGHPVGRDGGGHARHRAAGVAVPDAGEPRSGVEIFHPLRRRHRAGAVRDDPALFRGGEAPRRRTAARCCGPSSNASRATSSRRCCRSPSCSCWSATAPRSGSCRCTTGCPTRMPRVRRRCRPCSPGCCSTSRCTRSSAARCWSKARCTRAFAKELMMGFGLLSVVVAAFLLSRQKDVKRLFAYSSIEHMGIITFAFGMGGPVANFAGPAAHDRAFADQVRDLLRRRPRDAEGRHAGHRRHPRPHHDQPDDRLGADARHAGDPRACRRSACSRANS